jgi:hypothetical protein
MVFVALAALNFTVIRVVLDHRSNTSTLLGLGALPMANILAVGLLIGHRRRGSRPFLLGFEVFGATALALYVASVSSFGEEVVIAYLRLLLDPLEKILGRYPLGVLVATLCSVAVVMLSLPQVAFALIGGFLSRKYRVTITKRPPSTPC